MARSIQVQASKAAQRKRRAERAAEPVTEWPAPCSSPRAGDSAEEVLVEIEALLGDLE